MLSRLLYMGLVGLVLVLFFLISGVLFLYDKVLSTEAEKTSTSNEITIVDTVVDRHVVYDTVVLKVTKSINVPEEVNVTTPPPALDTTK